MTLAAPVPQPAIRIRPRLADDTALISATWKQSFWRESLWGHAVRWPVFNAGFSKVVERLLARSTVLVACDPGSDDDILGYLVFEPGALVWAFVKPAFRRAGIFTALLAATGLPKDLLGIEAVCCTRPWLGWPAMVDKATGAPLKPARPGIGDKFKATHNPFRAFE